MDISLIFKALSEPSRLKIYECLLERKHCTRSLSKKLKISESAISQHMKIMKEANLVTTLKHGYHIHYMINIETLSLLEDIIHNYKVQSLEVDQNPRICNCEYRRRDKHV